MKSMLVESDPGFARELLLDSSSGTPRGASPHVTDVKALWISDVHLGAKSCKAHALLSFLDTVRPETLYLVGDIIDEWKLRRSYYWPEEHDRVLRRFAGLAQEGTRVVYITGNHDESLRTPDDSVSLDWCECKDEVIHETLDGRKLLVVHGDRFDGYSDEGKWVVRVGEFAYEAILGINHVYNRVGKLFGARYRSISLALKHRVKEAVDFISKFEVGLVEEGRRRGLDGVVCGHIHKAELRDVDGFLYANDGDWVESCTALVETAEGQLELLQWQGQYAVPIGGQENYTAPDPELVMSA